ncbi:3-methyl-2-oxobutanoate hydroxymethyltransferase [Oxalobacteraceae bacterium CAVE-383]|nr:3-methyl-2-oxobutanoate hydroxymethyltransferase [Oxalobacteraceae bacterium CAVE-383]
MAGYIQEKTGNTESSARSKPVTMPQLQALCDKGEKLTMLTCYDASFASLMDNCGVEILLVGDSLGMVCQGHDSTLPVTLEEMAYHTACVARGNRTALLVTDMPFGTYSTPEAACRNATRLIQAGAHMVKIEGGAWLAETIQYLYERAIPVCAHIGLTPQSVHLMGGYKVQGKTAAAAERMMADALALQQAGACMVVLEAIPAQLGKELSDALHMPTIGIGAGVDCDGQVLVMHDMLGAFPGRKARFVRNFMEGSDSIAAAVSAYVAAVKDGSFPAPEHCF